ncbi:WD40-repeat-containing domain protein, partial [Vararia minispora EC-137]
LFPWSFTSVNHIWGGAFSGIDETELWKAMVRDWAGVAIFGRMGGIIITSVIPGRLAKRVMFTHSTATDQPVSAVGWAFRKSNPFTPLALFACSRSLYILDARTCELLSVLVGHGGRITSIAVHPSRPHLICTTSRDFTGRIYDLHKSPSEGTDGNPPWNPTSPEPGWRAINKTNRGGGPHGLHATEPEGYSPGPLPAFGRCVSVLLGNRPGGHCESVLSAAFHPTLPVIATSGLDRAVKIWHLRLPGAEDSLSLFREFTPLLSTSALHTAGVLSVSWLDEDTLISHSMPAFWSYDCTKQKPGEIKIWKWLSKGRFFPSNLPWIQGRMRGTASDYEESASFQILSAVQLTEPPLSPSLRTFNHHTLGPAVCVSLARRIRILGVRDLARLDMYVRKIDSGSATEELDKLAAELDDSHIASDEDDDYAEDTEKKAEDHDDNRWHPGYGCRSDDVLGSHRDTLHAIDVGFGGRVVVGIDTAGAAWIWYERAAS